MKKIISLLTAAVFAISNFSFRDISAATKKDDVIAIGESYLKIIQNNSYYMNHTEIYSGYKDIPEYVNGAFLPEIPFFGTDAKLSYTLYDIAGDGTPEMLLAMVNDDIYFSYGFYGFEDGKLKSFDDRIIPSNRYCITENNMVKNLCGKDDVSFETAYYSLDANSATLKPEIAYIINEEGYIIRKNGKETEISEKEYQKGLQRCEKQYKEKELDWYTIDDPTAIYEYMSQAIGDSVPGTDITEKVSDSELIQIQNCIKLLNGFFMKKELDGLDISSLSEFDIANVMAFIGEYYDPFVGEQIDAGEPPADWIGPWFKYLSLNDMYEAAYKYFGVDVDGVFEQLTIYEQPADSKVGWITEGNIKTVNGIECLEIGEQVDVAPAITPYIEKIYSLTDDCSYVLYRYNDEYADNKPCTEPLKKLDDNSTVKYGYAIMRNRVEDGMNHYYIEQCGLRFHSFLTVSELNEYIVKDREKSNIEIDYTKVKNYKEAQSYIDYLIEVMGDIKPNDRAKYDIVKYIEYAIENSCAINLKIGKDGVKVDSDCIKDAIASVEKMRVSFEQLLSERNIKLNKDINVIIKINCKNAEIKKGVALIYDKTLMDMYDRFDGIRVVLDDNCHTIYTTSEQIKRITENDINSVYVKQSKNNYQIKYIGANNEAVPRIDEPITFTFKANSSLDTVYFKKSADESLNWGGQIDDLNGTIEINTGMSGDYYIEKNETNISDVSSLTEEEREAIDFIISRGFMELSDGKFGPYMSLSRYDFTRAIVSLFYELNLDAKCIFPDVDVNNVYYPYIASAEERNTVIGYEDNTFRGNNHTTREELISIAARTLADKKGYFYPENTEEYIRFVDKELIQGWDNQYEEIALAVREGLIESGGVLAPQMNITRVDAAVILYRLFNLLYDTSPAALAPMIVENTSFPIVPVTAAGVVAAAGIGTVVFIFRKRIK